MSEVNEELEGNNPVRWCAECGQWIEEPCDCEHEESDLQVTPLLQATDDCKQI